MVKRSVYHQEDTWAEEMDWPAETDSGVEENKIFYELVRGKDNNKPYKTFIEAYHDISRIRLVEDRYKKRLHPQSLYQRTRKAIISRLELTKSDGKTQLGKIFKKYKITPLDFDFICAIASDGSAYHPQDKLNLYDNVTSAEVDLHLSGNNLLIANGLIKKSDFSSYTISERFRCELFGIKPPKSKKMESRSDYELEKIRMIEQENQLYNSQLKKEQEEKNKVKYSIKPVKDFNDIVINDKTKTKLQSAITLFQKRELINQIFGLNKIHNTESIILNFHGPPGVGKTLAAEVLAKSLSKQLIIIDYSEIESKWIGETEQNLSRAFKEAEQSKAVLLFDEVDAIAHNRKNNTGAPWYNMAVNCFLKELEKFKGICIMATNMPNLLDSALERRVLMHIGFEQPNVVEREQIFKLLLKHSAYDKEIDFKQIARKYDFSGGLIKNAIINAIAVAASEDAQKLEEKHMIKGCELVKEGSMAIFGTEEKVTYWG